MKNKEILKDAIELDNSKWGGTFKFSDLIGAAKDIESRNYKVENVTNSTYIVLYNGNPSITLELAILGAIANSNMIFMIYDNNLATNNILVKMIEQIAEKNETKIFIKLYNNISKEDIKRSTELADKIIYIGDKFEYHNVKRNYGLPVIYNDYGNIAIYTDDEESFAGELAKINSYAFENDIAIDFYNGNIEKELEYINYGVAVGTCAIFSNDENSINLFKNKVNSKKIFVNESPFKEYKFDFDINDLIVE